MTFKLIPQDEVVLYLRRNFNKKNKRVRDSIKNLLNKLDSTNLKVFLAFQNDYGENYLIVGYDLKRWWWAGDESDWETASSVEEDAFVRECLEVTRCSIRKDPLD